VFEPMWYSLWSESGITLGGMRSGMMLVGPKTRKRYALEGYQQV
jgi:hypothetical protein